MKTKFGSGHGGPVASFTPVPSMLAARTFHTATLMQNGKVLVAGGEGPSGPATPSAELYDPTSNTWAVAVGTLPSSLTPRYAHTATLLQNGKVLVVGGIGSSGSPIPSVELYDPTATTWSPAAPLLTPSAWHTATLLQNGQVFIRSGVSAVGAAPQPSPPEIYDPGADKWSRAQSGNDPGGTATLLQNGEVLIAGGPASSSCAIYNPANNTWSPAAALPDVRYFHTATILPTGVVLVAGGWYNPAGGNPTPTPSVVAYDVTTNQWPGLHSLNVARTLHTATLVLTDKVLVIGGCIGGPNNAVTPSAELYDPTSNTWSVGVGTLHTARENHTATRLNGRVLVAGGDNGSTPLASAEIWVY